MRLSPVIALSLIAAMVPASLARAESSTIRIEPRPYYGAVVTLEQGVRVWRPLPPTRHMIINPTNAPVHVNVADVRETITHNGLPTMVAPPVASSADGGYYNGPYYYGRRGLPLRHRGLGHRHRAGGRH